MNLKATYNLLAEDWYRDHRDDTWWIEGTDKFTSYFKPGSLILDAGCGAGVKSKYLIGKGLRVMGIDFSENLVKIAKREIPNGKFSVMDMREADKLDQEFDGIFAQASLLHIPKNEIQRVMRILSDKLNDRGYFYIAVKEKKPDGPEEEIKKENGYGYEYERFFSYFAPDEFRKCFKEIGLQVCYETIEPSGNTRWIQIIGQKEG